MMVKTLAVSTRVVAKGMGPPLRGLVHSAFAGAANMIFPDGFLLSLNASAFLPSHPTPQIKKQPAWDCVVARGPMLVEKEGGLLIPNGVLISAGRGEFPFVEMRVGTPVVMGAGWLTLEAISCSLDFAHCPRWDPHIARPAALDKELVRANGRWLAQFCRSEDLSGLPELEECADEAMLALAERLCGRGAGLTPSGDDFLAGWMAAGWLLSGPQPAFLALCQQICEIAHRRTHALSQCWLAYAAEGDVAMPVGELLAALATPDQARLERAARGLLALGATSGFDLLQGILYYLANPNHLTVHK
jgi:hypothetical protein